MTWTKPIMFLRGLDEVSACQNIRYYEPCLGTFFLWPSLKPPSSRLCQHHHHHQHGHGSSPSFRTVFGVRFMGHFWHQEIQHQIGNLKLQDSSALRLFFSAASFPFAQKSMEAFACGMKAAVADYSLQDGCNFLKSLPTSSRRDIS